MKFNILKTIVAIVLLSLIHACVNDDTYTADGMEVKTYDLVANKTAPQIIAMATTSSPTLYVNDDIIEAYVTSSDETGNFFTTICFQTLSVGGALPVGFSVSADFKSFGHGFTPGRKVFIKLKDLFYAQVDGSMKLGALYQGGIGRIPTADWNKHLFPAATVVPESQLISTLTMNQINNNANLNILIDLENVEFGDNALGRTLFDASVNDLGNATNHTIVGVGTTSNTIFRTSSFSSFARAAVPAGRGKIRGVLTKFGSTFQFYIRNLGDFQLNSPRTYAFSSTLNEGFQSFVNNQKILPGYLNFSTEGTKDWIVKSGNFLEMSSFGGTVERNKSYFIVPVDMSAANSFSFQVKIQFFSNRTGLRVYRTMDFVPGMKLSDATLFDISGSFAIPSATTSAFASAGTYNIPATVTGNGYFVFEYSGTSISAETLVTTTVQIDNIVVN